MHLSLRPSKKQILRWSKPSDHTLDDRIAALDPEIGEIAPKTPPSSPVASKRWHCLSEKSHFIWTHQNEPWKLIGRAVGKLENHGAKGFREGNKKTTANESSAS